MIDKSVIAHALLGLGTPATKAEALAQARVNKTATEVMVVLKTLPEKLWNTSDAVAD
jgi:hypothetical protein